MPQSFRCRSRILPAQAETGRGSQRRLFDTDDHRVRTGELFDARFPETNLAHPALAVGAAVVEAAVGFDQHVQAHHQAEGVLAAVVIDDSLIDDVRAAVGQSVISLTDEHFLRCEIPVVQDVAHDDYVGLGERILEKTARRECQAAVEAELGSVILEDRAYLRQVEPDGMEVGMRESNLRSSVALGCAYIANGLVVFKGKPSSDSEGTAMAEAGHSTQESLETLGIGVEWLANSRAAAA